VTVATERTPDPIPGVVIHRSGRVEAARHSTRRPPQTRIEETIIDLTQTAVSRDDAVGWLARAVGARLTTPARLVEAIGKRKKLRSRSLLLAGLQDVATGCHSLLEVWYLRDVERAHGLPRADRQAPGSGRRYRDVLYRRYGTVVELDGRAAHPEDLRFRDLRRDNMVVAEGACVLRYGAVDVTSSPCAVAAQVITVLRRAGWQGNPRRCSRLDCVIA
jgi:very-short-patch-repair endonuclease